MDNNVPQLIDGEEFHAFLAHSSDDVEFSKEIKRLLEEKGFLCFHSDTHFKPGQSILSNIEEGIMLKCRRVVPIVTQSFLESNWTAMEIDLAAYKQSQERRVIIIPLLKPGVSVAELPTALKIVNYIQHGSEDWESKLTKALCDDVELMTVIPAGDIGNGMAWCYFFGFLNLILQNLVQRIRGSDYWSAERKFLMKMVVIIPESCYCPDQFHKQEEGLTFLGELPFTASRGGHPQRNYKSCVYKIQDQKNNESYYFVGEFASILMNVYEMEKHKMAKLQPSDRKVQMEYFHNKLIEILESKLSQCAGTTVLIKYRDAQSGAEKPDHLPSLLLRVLTAELEKQRRVEEIVKSSPKETEDEGEREMPEMLEMMHIPDRSIPAKMDNNIPQLSDGEEFHAFLAHSSDDVELSREIQHLLEEKGFLCFHSDTHFKPGQSIVSNIEEGIMLKCRRVIPIVTKSFLESDWIAMEIHMAAYKQSQKRRVIIIPLLKPDVSVAELPAALKLVNYIQHGSEEWESKLRKALCDDVELMTVIPAGNIGNGMAWSYFFGFLNLILPNLVQRIHDSDYWSPERKFLVKMVVIIPESCYCPDQFHKQEEGLTFLGELPFTASRGGHPQRNYKSCVYKIQDQKNNESYYFVGEFASILMNVYEMEQHRLAKLQPSDRTVQMKLFNNKLIEILESNLSQCAGTTVLIKYRDERSGTAQPDHLPSLLLRVLTAEMEKQRRVEEILNRSPRETD